MSRNHCHSYTVGRFDAPFHVIIFHGYTASPDNLRGLACRIADELDAFVHIPLLPGHGTTVEDLCTVTFDEFVAAAQKTVRDTEVLGVPYAIIGYSFGGHLAGITASRSTRKPNAVVIAIAPYLLRFPFSTKIASWLMTWRHEWHKKFTSEQLRERRRMSFYRFFPGIGLALMQQGILTLKAALPTLAMPLLALSAADDAMVSPSSAAAIIDDSGKNAENQSVVINGRDHELFMGEKGPREDTLVIEFLKKIIA